MLSRLTRLFTRLIILRTSNFARKVALLTRLRRHSIDIKNHTANKQLQSPFFAKLPPEIRNMIYELVLAETGRVDIMVRTGDQWHKPAILRGRTGKKWRSHLSRDKFRVNGELLRTCRQIYREAIDILYARNAFVFGGRLDFYHFQRLTPHCRFRKIRTVCVADFDFLGLPQFSHVHWDLPDSEADSESK